MTTTTAMTEVLAAATALTRAGRWDTADRLLAATDTDRAVGAAAIAVAVAEVAVDRDLFTGTSGGADAIRNAAAVEAAGDTVLCWDLARLRLFGAYVARIFGDGNDTFDVAATVSRADELRDTAPDDSRRGWAAFTGGLVADNLGGDKPAAALRYNEALRLAEDSGDELLASYALRHLGAHDEAAGEIGTARQRSAALRARAGHVTGVLAQHTALATLAEREGDRAAARALADRAGDWAGELGLIRIRQEAESLLAR